MLPSSSTRPAAAAAVTEQRQLRQMRAQCLVFLAFKYVMLVSKHLNLCKEWPGLIQLFLSSRHVFVCATPYRNQMEPRKRHLEIALGEDEIDGAGCHGETAREPLSSSAAPLPLPHLLPISSLRLSPPVTEQEPPQRRT
ncbi:uncharacterized protein LOC123431207 isoform X1 [Hordeum vulgare subsp. vulgare]|uniref:Uncharacterized protein n=1 Tax=Hordeum vulgare subsp. vulgare TaxID=112509 RepID=A0A8I7B8H3_HORVV|nr:uncharacterized protein LOC123431207 isoform X1 [Hordeum vulgare subsp. vulgare]